MNRHPSFNEELAAHLEGRAHPLPHPSVARRRADTVPDIASSYAHEIRERALVVEGFVPWHGRGACPVPPETVVDVIYPDGSRYSEAAASDVLDWRLVAYYRLTPVHLDITPMAWAGLAVLGFGIGIAMRLLGVI